LQDLHISDLHKLRKLEIIDWVFDPLDEAIEIHRALFGTGLHILRWSYKERQVFGVIITQKVISSLREVFSLHSHILESIDLEFITLFSKLRSWTDIRTEQFQLNEQLTRSGIESQVIVQEVETGDEDDEEEEEEEDEEDDG
jgi:hypothetical protein